MGGAAEVCGDGAGLVSGEGVGGLDVRGEGGSEGEEVRLLGVLALGLGLSMRV